MPIVWIGKPEFRNANEGSTPSVGIPSEIITAPANLFLFCEIYSAIFPIFVVCPEPLNLPFNDYTSVSKECDIKEMFLL